MFALAEKSPSFHRRQIAQSIAFARQAVSDWFENEQEAEVNSLDLDHGRSCSLTHRVPPRLEGQRVI